MWKSYTTNKALSTTKRVQLVDPKELIIAVSDTNSEMFVVQMTIRKQEEMPVHSEKWAQIQDRAMVGALLFDIAPIKVPVKYSNYNNIFSAKNAVKLSENTGINEYAIKLEEDKQTPFGPIYSLGPVELKTLKTCIETNLANDFVQPSKSPARAFIFFDRKPDRSFCLWINYRVSIILLSKTNIYCFWLVEY